MKTASAQSSLRLLTTLFALAAALAIAALPAGAVHRLDNFADEILQQKCSLCHGGHRIYHMDPAEVKSVVERMQDMNPDWITEVDKVHILEVLADVLNDSTIIAERKAWEEAVERGRLLFESDVLGTAGKSCADCHKKEDFVNVTDAFPRYEVEKRMLVSLPEKVNMMITDRMKGEPLEPLGQKMTDLEAYLKSLH